MSSQQTETRGAQTSYYLMPPDEQLAAMANKDIDAAVDVSEALDASVITEALRTWKGNQ